MRNMDMLERFCPMHAQNFDTALEEIRRGV